ncbi:MAG TPA: glycosyltransferase family 4 protein [Acetobacteraceae bacterium]|nr:glycosyltransferase family 4 protein [Acetobacteraceae bacterium]
MRILYSHRIQSRDGQSVHVEELIAAFRALGHHVMVVGPGFYQKVAFGGESGLVSTIRSRLPRWIGELGELAYNVPALWRLRRAHRLFRPDLIYERYNLYFLAGTLVSRRTGTPLFLEVNAPLADERGRHGGLGLPWPARWLEQYVWRSADRVLAVTGVLKELIAATGVPAHRIEVIPNGIDPSRFTALPPRPETSDPVVLGFVGFVRDWHGLDAVLAWMASDPATRLELVIVGDGPAIPALRTQAEQLGIAERVRFAGLVAHETIPAAVAAFDIALQARAVAYASPLKLFEYMAAEKAIVAPDQANIREVLVHGETALLFDPAVPDGMWNAVRQLAADPAARRRLGAAARSEIERNDYSWRGNAARVVRLHP